MNRSRRLNRRGRDDSSSIGRRQQRLQLFKLELGRQRRRRALHVRSRFRPPESFPAPQSLRNNMRCVTRPAYQPSTAVALRASGRRALSLRVRAVCAPVEDIDAAAGVPKTASLRLSIERGFATTCSARPRSRPWMAGNLLPES